ncbi:MAG TPA: SAF domain-containing protein [Gaiellales bacterium]|jgi:Flp pilus assembly protein CpaB
MSRHRLRSIGFALAGVVLAFLALTRLAGTGGHVAAAARVGRVVVVRPVPAGSRISAADLGIVRLPAAYASVHQLADPSRAVGRRAAVALVAGAPLMDAELASPPAVSDAREVAVQLDGTAGIPAGDLTGVRADVYVTPPGRASRSRLVLAGVLVRSATHSDGTSVATLVLPARAVPVAIAAEGEGALRLVVRDSGRP